MPKKKKRWLSGVQGWDKSGNIIETWWRGDPAIDQDKSDMDRYEEELERDALVVIKGEEPQLLRITMPTAGQLLAIQSAISGGFETAAAVAFALCVRFPELEEEDPPLLMEYRGGSRCLPSSFMATLALDPSCAMMIVTIGSWIWRKAFLSDSEKKVSSPESTEKTSGKPAPEKQESTTAEGATTNESESKDAQS